MNRTRIVSMKPGDFHAEVADVVKSGLVPGKMREEIGSRMSANFVAIPSTASVKEAMSALIRQAAEKDNISTLYLVDEAGTFCGVINLKDLIIAREGTALAEITTVCCPYLYAGAAVEDCLPVFRDYAEEAIPVLDAQRRLIGVVTARDFAELLDLQLGEDYAMLAGLSAEEGACESTVQSVRKRLPWLCVLLGMGLGVSAVVGLFESVLAKLPLIMCFQSLILDMAGNVGTQSLAVSIRALMDTRPGHSRRTALVRKEACVGFCNGCVLGTLSFIVIGAYLCLTGTASTVAFAVSGCLGAAMVLAMTASALSGTLIPIFFQHLGVDPAVASGPLITTVNDLVAVAAYYGLAWMILLRLMHLG